jgi:hypothetical protein
MRYLILGKNLARGVLNDDSAALNEYFELGWELVGSRIDLIRNLNSDAGYLNNTTIVTPYDRMFFYTKFTKNVESSEIFFLQKFNKLNPSDIVEDWTESLHFNFLTDGFVSKENGLYKFAQEDSSLIRDGFDLNKVKIQPGKGIPFVVISLRFRDHVAKRNSAPKKVIKLIKKLQKNGVKEIYIFGRGAEQVAEAVKATFISRLDEFVFLIKHDNCLGLIGQSSGPMVLALMTTPHLVCIIDPTGAADLNGNNAVLGGKCIQFGGGRITKFQSISRQNRKVILELIMNRYSAY